MCHENPPWWINQFIKRCFQALRKIWIMNKMIYHYFTMLLQPWWLLLISTSHVDSKSLLLEIWNMTWSRLFFPFKVMSTFRISLCLIREALSNPNRLWHCLQCNIDIVAMTINILLITKEAVSNLSLSFSVMAYCRACREAFRGSCSVAVSGLASENQSKSDCFTKLQTLSPKAHGGTSSMRRTSQHQISHFFVHVSG